MLYFWIKSLHIFFIAGWFAGLFYLPRIFVNLAMETDPAVNARLLLMSRKLYKFMTLIAVPALIFGLWLWLVLGVGKGEDGKSAMWIHAKLGIVLLLIGYHHACGSLLKKFERGVNTHSHKWYRWFNEVPTLLLLAAVYLAVAKPS
jgi:putative membrane protein